jgi:hypothetical protein
MKCINILGMVRVVKGLMRLKIGLKGFIIIIWIIIIIVVVVINYLYKILMLFIGAN